MRAKVTYRKMIQVSDEVSQEEIENMKKDIIPDKFDCMADQIDNVQPLEFDSYELISDNEEEENE